MKRPLALLSGAVLAASLALSGTAASAATSPAPEVLYEDLFTPLKLSLELDGSVYVTDNFPGTLNRIARDGAFSTPYTTSTPGNEVGAVSNFLGTVYFAETTATGSLLKKIDRRGNVSQLADLGAHEASANPDGGQQYGFTDLPADCAAQLPPFIPGAATGGAYTGEVYSHPYSTLGTPLGTVVADAGANALLTVDARGKVRTLATLPAQPSVIGDWATTIGLPACVVGHEYRWEAVPTDVELGPDGWIYASLLPGGPEFAEAGARGSVIKVNLLTGKVVTVATGLLAATDIAISPRGDIYVAELENDRISVIKKGSSTPQLFREAVSPAAVEWSPYGIYATVDAVPAFSEDPTAPPPPPTGDVVLFRF